MDSWPAVQGVVFVAGGDTDIDESEVESKKKLVRKIDKK